LEDQDPNLQLLKICDDQNDIPKEKERKKKKSEENKISIKMKK